MPIIESAVQAADGHRFTLRIAQSHSATAPVVMLFPAMAIAASYYDAFAEALAAAGLHCVVAENRGLASSSLRAKQGDNFGYAELLEQDWPAVVAEVEARYPDSRRFMLGNSLGGQLSALYLAANPQAAEKLVLIASCSVYHRAYPKPWKILASTQFLLAASQALGYLPGKRLGFAGYEAKGVIADWARQARSGNYCPSNSQYAYEDLLPKLSLPVLALPVAGDHLAPESAVDHLLSKLPRCQIEKRVIDAKQIGSSKLKHSNWGRYPGRLPELVADWLLFD